ncbi:MAG: flagellar biosynthetic protein FliR [Phycisphaerae bacterium]|nr:flagellar biosynthetic protein FliR [Phycisphaerae bacterium]
MNALTETAWVLTLLLATCRVVGVVVLAPPMGHVSVPLRLRVMLAAVIGLAVVGRLAGPIAVPATGLELAGAVGVELLLGATLGYAVRLIFVGVQLGAAYAAQQVGIGLADSMNPGETDSSGPIRRLFELLAVVVFVLLGGHLAVVGGLLQTFDTLPLAGAIRTADLLQMIITLLGMSFLLAIKVAAPVLVAMILATVVLGLLQRAMPQCNVFTIGLPIRVILGLVILAGALMLLGPLMESAGSATQQVLQRALEGGQ